MADLRFVDTREMAYGSDARFPGIGIKVLEGRATHTALSMIVARVESGRTIPTHTHTTETETAYVMAGTGILTVEGTEYVLEAGMSVTIPPGLAHSLHNGADFPLDIVAVHSPPTR